jgi:phosphatidylglycerol lysyltransferase
MTDEPVAKLEVFSFMNNDPGSLKINRLLHLEPWALRFSALFTCLMGIINLTSAIQPALQNRLAVIEAVIPLEVRHGSRITSALAGFGLILLAQNLWRRKRSAWVLTVLLLIVSILSHLIKGLDYEEASLGMGLLALLIIIRRSFHASSDRPSLRQGLIVLATAFGFTLVYGVAGFYFLDRHFNTPFGFLDALRQTAVMFTSFYNPGLEPITGFGKYFAGSIYIVGLGTVVFALLMLISPVLVRLPATSEERSRAEAIVQQHGRTALARATLFDDKSYFFGSGDTVIAYAARRRGVIALGDPIGPPDQVPAVISAFQDFCTQNDWTPAFASTLPDYLEAYRAAGLEAVCIGYEAIVVLDGFSLDGSENKGIRNAVSRMERSGYRAEVHLPPLEDKLMQSLHSISDAWLTMQHGGEMHFSDGWFEDRIIRTQPVIVVHAPDGNPTAFANLVSEYQKNERTIDLMRHFGQVEHGTMEFLFVKMLQWAKEEGYDTFSLGLSAIVGVGEKPDDPRVEQALHSIAETVSHFYHFKGLHNFKNKFHPRWEPRYLVYPGAASLPLVLSTLVRVHSGNNFLWKFLRK